ncbi:ComF family protein [Candidatus Saccharibacteria bacterium]|nr:ComF family protein [Candidatus Saccharibacteria bacterium]
MVFGVKNTTILWDFSVFDVLCPENCRGCGEKGELVCGRCKKYIFEHYENHCPVCKKKISGGVCSECKKGAKRRKGGVFLEEGDVEKGKEAYRVFKGIYSVGYRDEFIGELVEEYKYYSVRGLARGLGEILEKTAIRELKNDFFWDYKGKYKKQGSLKGRVLMVPLPTARKHIRERGFDHTELILKKVREGERKRLLVRAKDTTQVGASEAVRLKQAKEAYNLNPKFLGENGRFKEEVLKRSVVLFDDVWTTGASMIEAAKNLRNAGATEIYGVVLAVNRKGRKPILRRGEV